MERYIGSIISDARADTGTDSDIPSSTVRAGFRSIHYLRYANYAQADLQAQIVTKWQSLFTRTATFSVAAGQKVVDLKSDTSINILMNTHVKRLRFYDTGDVRDAYRLEPLTSLQETDNQGAPQYYWRSDSTLVLMPVPEKAGSLEVLYTRALPRLALRFASLPSVSAGPQTVITLDPATIDAINYPTPYDSDYLCIHTASGTLIMQNVQFTAINTTTGAVTLAASTVFPTVTNAYVTLGRFTTTHSELPEQAERYLTLAIARHLLAKQPGTDYARIDKEFNTAATNLLALYAPADQDTPTIGFDPLLAIDDGTF